MSALPIDELIAPLRAALAAHSNAVLQAAPGAGKTTRVPLALLDCDWLAGRKIVMLEPRRLAARSAARYMARALGERPGQTVGYRVRLESRIGSDTRIEVVTEGILARMLQSDPALEDTGLVIFDEFHERNLQADLALALSLDAQSALREDLRILVMSATLSHLPVAQLLGDVPTLESEGRSFPVEIRYHPLRADYTRERRAFLYELAGFVAGLLPRESGSVLVFLPGTGEIREVERALRGCGLPDDVELAPLYGQLDARAQDAAIRPAAAHRRKVVLATAVAETSLTIEGIRVVVDAGLARRAVFDPGTAMQRLVTQPVSRAQATQRSGRAGRLESGVCYRLWSAHRHLVPHADPQIQQADLAPLVLELAQWGVRDTGDLRWLDPPPAAHVGQARELLQRLQALDTQGMITAHGRELATFGIHPRLAHMLLRARAQGEAGLACELAALLGERDPLRSGDSDIQQRVAWLRGVQHRGVAEALRRQLRALAGQLHRQLTGKDIAQAQAQDPGLCGALLAWAYPDRIAQRRGGAEYRFLLANGRGARFRDAEPLAGEDYLVALNLDGEREARIFLAAALPLEHLYRYHTALIETRPFVGWDEGDQCVKAQLRERLGALVLGARGLDKPDPQATAAAMLGAIEKRGVDVLPWNDAARGLQARIAFARRVQGEAWPDLSDSALSASFGQWLIPYLFGLTRLSQLKRLDMHQILLGRLSWEQQQRLNTLAPTHLSVPSGSRIRLDYSGEEPVLAVRLQELFGLQDTPRVGEGRVAVVLHLLSPAQRPVQITRDLAGFWSGSYQAVKKDLKGRYPKHHWPDDPRQAEASARARPRKPR